MKQLEESKMKVDKDQFVLGLDPEVELLTAEEKAKGRDILSHYTSWEVLKLIFTNKHLLFNRIDKVNDHLESEMFVNKEVSHLIYVSCFTYDEYESIPMWNIYGKSKDAVRIKFEMNQKDFSKALINEDGTVYNPTDLAVQSNKQAGGRDDWRLLYACKDIVYNQEFIKKDPIFGKNISIEKGKHYNLRSMGVSKREEWQYEKECRLIAYMRTTHDDVEIPDISYLLVPIKFDSIRKVTITFNPWMSDRLKTDIKQFMGSIVELTGKVDFKSSVLTGEIKKF